MPVYHNRVNAIVLWADMVIVSVCFLITLLLFQEEAEPFFNILSILLWFFLLTGWYYSAKSYNLYEGTTSRGVLQDIFKSCKGILAQAVFISVFLFLAKSPEYSRKFAGIYLALLAFLMPLNKILYKKILIFFVEKGVKIRQVLIVGAGKVGKKFHHTLKTNIHLGYQVLGFLDDNPAASPKKHLGRIDQLKEVLQEYSVDEIVIALPNSASDKIGQIIQVANQETVRVRIIPDYFQYFSAKYGIGMMEGIPMITLRREPLEEFHLRAIKRAFDIVFSAAVLVFICSWLFPIIALLIKLESPGPVFFVQLRTGRNKRPFKCIKFRSMQVNQEANAVQAKKNDSRLTRVGKFLRKTNLDEFPQFINVLKGEMSVVGPRPHMLKHTEEYSRLIDRYLVRHLLKSGITGWAQVNGYRGETRDSRQMQARIEYDVWYLENWSLWFDLKIIFLTVWNTIKGDKKAY